MLFNEIYGTYFNIVSGIIDLAIEGKLSDRVITDIVYNYGFAESTLSIPEKIKSREWPLICDDRSTPIVNKLRTPLTVLQKRWLKSLLTDPRIKLFDVDLFGLEEVEPLYSAEDIVYFDQYVDGDDYESAEYIKNFRTILSAIKQDKSLKVAFTSSKGLEHRWHCKPEAIEYSLKDDKFRIHVKGKEHRNTINIGRITECDIVDDCSEWTEVLNAPDNEEVVIEIEDERNALERVMLQFSPLRKETVKLDDTHYRMKLFYNPEDEVELLIDILSFGPMIRVVEPEPFIELIKERLNLQRQL